MLLLLFLLLLLFIEKHLPEYSCGGGLAAPTPPVTSSTARNSRYYVLLRVGRNATIKNVAVSPGCPLHFMTFGRFGKLVVGEGGEGGRSGGVRLEAGMGAPSFLPSPA